MRSPSGAPAPRSDLQTSPSASAGPARRRAPAAPALLSLLLLAGACSSAESPEIHRYLVRDRAAEARAVPPNPKAPTLHVAKVDVAGHLEGIAILRDGGVVDTLVYHRFAAPVAEMVARMLLPRLERSGAFRAVLGPESLADAALSLRVDVGRFELEEHSDGSTVAVVVLDAELYRRGSREVLETFRATAATPARAGRTEVKDLVLALEDAASSAADTLAAAVAARAFAIGP